MEEWAVGVEKNGFAIAQNVFSESVLSDLLRHIADPTLRRSRAGIRHALGVKAISDLAQENTLIEMARAVLGNEAIPFRATLFDKSPDSNWLVVWHQDTALPFRKRLDKAGWGPWSIKDGVNYAHAPARALENVLALRVHLDDSTLENGPLRVLPGTHRSGVLTDDQIEMAVMKASPVDCLVRKGGVLAMRPLIVHASSKSSGELPRRVLHIEYASSRHIENDMELAIA
jgi:ectoine hydroxylase-related dioxygenase (phytanoyl-CoA dioxygenase family)